MAGQGREECEANERRGRKVTEREQGERTGDGEGRRLEGRGGEEKGKKTR